MTHLQVLLVATITWIAWIPATSLQRLARGDSGSVSISPVIPVDPLAAWGLAYVLPLSGVAVVGIAHLGLLVLILFSIAKSKRILRSKGS